MSSQLLLKAVTVIELAGLAPGPLCGQMLSDYGARVIRVDRLPSANGGFNPDQLTRGKQSISLDLRNPAGQAALRTILETDKVDVLIDTYRPGVLERLNILPTKRANNKQPLVVARLTGYGQTGPLANFAGHDINYLAEAGILSIVGPPGTPPAVPANILGDFAALSLPGFSAITTALYSGLRAQLAGEKFKDPYTFIDVNIVSAIKYLAQFATYAKYGPYNPSHKEDTRKSPEADPVAPGFVSIVPWGAPRGENVLEGYICPYYTIYETNDHGYVTVGCLEPQFYTEFQKLVFGDDEAGLKVIAQLPTRNDPQNWDSLRKIYAEQFKLKDMVHWTSQAYKYPNSCVMPVKPLAHSSEIPDQIVKIGASDSDSGNPRGYNLTPGKDTDRILEEFLGKDWKLIYGDGCAAQAKSKRFKI